MTKKWYFGNLMFLLIKHYHNRFTDILTHKLAQKLLGI